MQGGREERLKVDRLLQTCAQGGQNGLGGMLGTHGVMGWSCWGWLSMLIWKVSSYAGGLFVISWRACVLKLKGRALVHPCPLLMDSAPENSSKKPLPAADKQRVSAGDMLPAQASG